MVVRKQKSALASARKKTAPAAATTTARRKKAAPAREEPELGWQNISLWENDRGTAVFSGKVNFTPEFLEEMLFLIDEGELELDERGYVTVNVAIRDNLVNTRNAPLYLGNIYIPEEQPEERAPRRSTSKSAKSKTRSTRR